MAFTHLDELNENDLEYLNNLDELRRQLVGWYREYNKLNANFYNQNDLYTEAIRILTTTFPGSLFRDFGLIIIFLPESVSSVQVEFMATLTAKVQATTILGLTGEKAADKPAIDLAQKLGLSTDSKGPPSAGPDKMADHMVVSHDSDEETQWVIRDIIRQAANGSEFGKIAVLYRNQHPYAEILQTKLRLAGIPLAGDETRDLSDTPTGKLVTNLLSVIKNDYSRDSVMKLVAEAPDQMGQSACFARKFQS